MIKLTDERALELERIEIARKRREEIITIPQRVDAHTYILVRKGKCCKEAVEVFKKAWKEFQDYDSKRAEPFLSK
ncbi:MAG: hypothetical protein WCP55_19545 [Lentisphaerota bacterium]